MTLFLLIIAAMVIYYFFIYKYRSKNGFFIKYKKRCPNCKNAVEESFNVCPICKETLKKKCETCGEIVYAEWKYCPYCAKHINKSDVR